MHYEGSSIYALDVKQAKKTLDNLIYMGERPLNMTWTKFEQQLNTAFAIYVKVEKRVVYSDAMKLGFLLDKVKSDTLKHVSAALTVAIKGDKNYTYTKALKVYKAEVQKSGTSGQMRNPRHIREQNRGRGRRGRIGFGQGF